MKKYGFEWPEHMDCDLFPEYGSTNEVCMDPNDQEQKQQQEKKPKINDLPKTDAKKKLTTSLTLKTSRVYLTDDSTESQFLANVCQHPFIKLTKETDPRLNKLSTGGLINCIQPCKSVYFNQWENMFSSYWLFIWTLICLVSSLATTCTYLIDSSRFKYPEKPIIYLSICYLFVSFGYLLRFVVGHEKMACESDGSARYEVNLSSNNMNTLTCRLTFIFIYYFGMASSVWWVIISLTWFLAAGLKWSTESIAKYSTYYHLLAWLLPFLKTIAILVLSLVDADPLSGVCYVGNLNAQNLRLFVLTPAITYLTVGITFLIAGFISLFRIRNMIKQQHGDINKAHKIEKLMLRIGVFSILYTVPATCVIACQFYEQHYRHDWERNLLCKQAKYSNDKTVDLYCSTNKLKSEFSESPEFSVFILKYLMSLIVGITSGFWILSKKTLRTWVSFLKRVFCCAQQVDKLKSLESDSDTHSARGSSCFLFGCKRSKTNRNRKDSIVYFQANDDLENNPHNLLYDSATTTSTNNQQQQQQHLLPAQIYQSDSTRLIPTHQSTFSALVPDSFAANNNNNQFNVYQIQNNNNCHTNRAAAFYYDYSNLNTSSSNKNETGSSKYSFQSSTISSSLPITK